MFFNRQAPFSNQCSLTLPYSSGNVRSKTLSYARSIVASIEEEHDSLYTSMDEEDNLPETAPKKSVSGYSHFLTMISHDLASSFIVSRISDHEKLEMVCKSKKVADPYFFEQYSSDYTQASPTGAV